LKYEIANKKTTHAYLFSGSRGTGKTTCAKILAKAANCLKPANGNPCGVCEPCEAIESGTTTDILEMDAASNTGVDYIRDIRDDVVYAPSLLKTRVYIIDEVHMLSINAFNALLKTLEEPPSQVMFILATTEPQKIPATILSRCQRFEFRRINNNIIAERLLEISANEGITLDHDAALIIARLAQGGMRDAISLLELCSGEGNTEINTEVVLNTAGVTGREQIIKICGAILDGNFNDIFEIIDDLYKSSKDITVFWADILSCYRDLLVIKKTKTPLEYLDITNSEFEELKDLADSYTIEKLLYHCKIADEAYVTLQQNNVSKRLLTEMTLIRMCDDRLDTSNEALAARIADLETHKIKIPERKSAAATVKSKEPARKRELITYNNWADVIRKYDKIDKMMSAFLNQSRAYTDNDDIVIITSNELAFNMLNKDEIKKNISELLESIENKTYRISHIKFEFKPQIITDGSYIDDFV